MHGAGNAAAQQFGDERKSRRQEALHVGHPPAEDLLAARRGFERVGVPGLAVHGDDIGVAGKDDPAGRGVSVKSRQRGPEVRLGPLVVPRVRRRDAVLPEVVAHPVQKREVRVAADRGKADQLSDQRPGPQRISRARRGRVARGAYDVGSGGGVHRDRAPKKRRRRPRIAPCPTAAVPGAPPDAPGACSATPGSAASEGDCRSGPGRERRAPLEERTRDRVRAGRDGAPRRSAAPRGPQAKTPRTDVARRRLRLQAVNGGGRGAGNRARGCGHRADGTGHLDSRGRPGTDGRRPARSTAGSKAGSTYDRVRSRAHTGRRRPVPDAMHRSSHTRRFRSSPRSPDRRASR